jgi:purine-cytosine permease-like protein
MDSRFWSFGSQNDYILVRPPSTPQPKPNTQLTCGSRYSFGYWGNLLVVIFSMVSTTGWNAINSISGASVLFALSDGKMPIWAGVILICTIIWIICALGIQVIHKFDAFLWIPPFLCWCVTAGTGAKHFSGDAIKSPMGANGAAAALSFMAVIFSFAVSWVNCASDYNVRMPLTASRWKIGVATYIGIAVPTILVQSLGAALYTGTETNPVWKAAFKAGGVGGPLKLALEPAGGFGKLLLVFAALSAIPVCLSLHSRNFFTNKTRITSPTITHLLCTPRTSAPGLSAFHASYS